MECTIDHLESSIVIQRCRETISVQPNENVKFIKDLDYALSDRQYEKVSITNGNGMSFDEIELLCNVLIANTNKFTTLRLSFTNDPHLSVVIRHLVRKVKCHTLFITACDGNNWLVETAKFISSSKSLKILSLISSFIELNDEMVNAIINTPNLVSFSFSPLHQHRSLYKKLGKIILNGELQSLTISGCNIYPSAIRTLEESMRGNMTLKSFSNNMGQGYDGTGRPFSSSLWKKNHDEYLNIVCNKTSLDDIAASNHTLHRMDFSTHHDLLHNCLGINKSTVPTKCKIKQKMFLCHEVFDTWMTELATDSHRAVVQQQKYMTRVHFIHWLGNSNDMVPNLALTSHQCLIDFIRMLLFVR